MKTVAIVTSGAYSVANFRGTLIEELVGQGVRVLALAPDWSDDTRAATSALGAETVDISLSRVGMDPTRDLADIVRLAGVLRRLRPDAVLTYFAKPNVYGMIAAALARVPRRIAMVEGLGFVFDSSGPASRKAGVVRAVTMRLYRFALGFADKVLFLNRDDEAFFRNHRLVAPAKVVNTGGIGVDLDAFAATPAVTDPVVFLLMARLLRGKGVIEFAEAAARVRARSPATRFVLLGDVDANPDSLKRDEVTPWVENGAIEWPGHVSDVRERLAAASVFVLPAWTREGLPRSTQEAAAMAKPVITTDVVGCRDTVVDGVNGFMVRAKDVDALVGAMMRFVEEPGLVATMGAASRRIAEERWDGREKSAALAAMLVG